MCLYVVNSKTNKKKPVSKPLYINELILFSILHAYYVIQTLITTRTSNFLTAGWKIALTYTSMYMYIAFIRDRKNCNSSNYEWWMLWRWPFTSYQWPWPLFVLTSTQQFFKYIKRARWSWTFLDYMNLLKKKSSVSSSRETFQILVLFLYSLTNHFKQFKVDPLDNLLITRPSLQEEGRARPSINKTYLIHIN